MLVEFILKASTARTDSSFTILDPSSSGRMDLVSRCILATFKQINGFRRDVNFYAILEGPSNPPICIKFIGRELERIPSDELETTFLIKELLEKKQSLPGVYLIKESFEELTTRLAKKKKIFLLNEKGIEFSNIFPMADKDLVFVLGDHIGLNEDKKRFLANLGAIKLCIGPHSYLTSHCIIFIQEEIDFYSTRRTCPSNKVEGTEKGEGERRREE